MGRASDAKERLMKAVGELIWTGSYGSTTIDQICEKAGVKKGSFYYFFDSKADLAAAALDAWWEDKRPDRIRFFPPPPPPSIGFGNIVNLAIACRPKSELSAVVSWVVRSFRWAQR